MSRIRTLSDSLARWSQATKAVSNGTSTSFSSLLQQQPSSSTQAASSFEPSRGKPPGKPPFLDAAASALGLTSEQLDAKLKGGQSLSDVASEQGVSNDTLRDALSADFKEKHPDATDSEASAVADRVMAGPDDSAAPSAARPAPPWLDAAAQSLGLDAEALAEKLARGERLTDIAAAQGVSTDTLKDALAADFTATHADATSTDAAAAVDGLLNGQQPNDLQRFRINDLQLRRIEP